MGACAWCAGFPGDAAGVQQEGPGPHSPGGQVGQRFKVSSLKLA